MSYTIPPIDFKASTKQADNIPDYDTFRTETNTYYLANCDTLKTEGGQSTVFTCTDKSGNFLAVKVFKEVPSSSQLVLMNQLAKLPNVMPILDSGSTDDGHYFQVMPFMTPILSHTISSMQEFQNLVKDLTNAIDGIHSANAIHRDITPFNCFWNNNHHSIYLGDLASAAPININIPKIQQNIHITKQLHIGTRGYSAPDLYLGVSPKNTFQTTSADLYSLGATLASICSGKDIFLNMSDSKYYTLLAEEGELPYNFPDYMNTINRSSVRCLINGLTTVSTAKRWNISTIKEWLRDPSKFHSTANQHSKVSDYSFCPAIYFNGHRYESGSALSAAMCQAPEAAKSFILSNDFLTYITNASTSLADTILELKKENIEVYLCKVIRLLDKQNHTFLFYKGKSYASINALKKVQSDIVYDILRYKLITFNAKHLSEKQSRLSDESLHFLENLEDFTEKNPELFRFNICVFRLFLSFEKCSELTPCSIIIDLCQTNCIKTFIIDHPLASINESNWEPLGFLYLNGFQNHIHDLLKTFASDITPYEKALGMCFFLESVLVASHKDPFFSEAAGVYLEFLKKSGPDSFSLYFCKFCKEKYISLDNSSDLLSNLSALYPLLSEATNYKNFQFYIQNFRQLYEIFLQQFQCDFSLSTAGIRCGKSIFARDKSGFFKKTPLNETVPEFCCLIDSINETQRSD